MKNLRPPVQLVASPFNDVCRPDSGVDVLENGALAFFVASADLLVSGTDVALYFLHLFVFAIFSGRHEDCHCYFGFKTFAP